MIVYMLLNTVTERAYVGATDKPLAERWARHLKDAAHGSEWPVHAAIREWPEEFWTIVVLCNCYSVSELSAAELAWKTHCCTEDPRVGYNDPLNKTSYAVTVQNGKKGGNPLTSGGTSPKSPLYGLTPEERREYFREAGRRGAAKSKATRRTPSG